MRTLKGIRNDLNLDQITMAKKLNWNYETYKRKEQGKVKLSFSEGLDVYRLIKNELDPSFNIEDLKEI